MTTSNWDLFSPGVAHEMIWSSLIYQLQIESIIQPRCLWIYNLHHNMHVGVYTTRITCQNNDTLKKVEVMWTQTETLHFPHRPGWEITLKFKYVHISFGIKRFSETHKWQLDFMWHLHIISNPICESVKGNQGKGKMSEPEYLQLRDKVDSDFREDTWDKYAFWRELPPRCWSH